MSHYNIMASKYRIIAFLIVILTIVLLSCSCLSKEPFTEGNSCGGYTDEQTESQLEKCTRLYNSNLTGSSEWDNVNCSDVTNEIPGYTQGFALLNPLKVVDNDTQPYNGSYNGSLLTSSNNLIINELNKTPGNSSCLNHDLNMGH